jgi:uncharacterized membrane protein YbhN (UPF0104 family)
MRIVPTVAKRWLVPLAGTFLSLASIFLIYRSLDFGRFVAEVQNARIGWIAVLAATILLEQLIHGWKWRQLLFDIKPVSSVRLTGAFLAGYGANILFPLGISPLVRSWLIARLENLKLATVLMTTAIARFIDGIVFAMFAAIVAIFGQVPQIEGSLRVGLSAAGVFNLVLFGGILIWLFRFRSGFTHRNSVPSRIERWLSRRTKLKIDGLTVALSEGILWPKQTIRQVAIVAASFAMKAVSATHYIWAGLAVGVTLGLFDYLFLMVFAGFALVLAKFIRVPGGFVIGSAFAMKLLGIPDELALAMILFNHIITIVLMVGIGGIVLWQNSIDIRDMMQSKKTSDAKV